MAKDRRRRRRRQGGGGFHNYYYVPGQGSGVFSPAIFNLTVRNMDRMPGIVPKVYSKDYRRKIFVYRNTVL